MAWCSESQITDLLFLRIQLHWPHTCSVNFCPMVMVAFIIRLSMGLICTQKRLLSNSCYHNTILFGMTRSMEYKEHTIPEFYWQSLLSTPIFLKLFKHHLFAQTKIIGPSFYDFLGACEEFLKMPPYLGWTHVWVAEKRKKNTHIVLTLFFTILLLHKFH